MNILTFDIEEWYHILEHPSTKTEKEWVKFEPRIKRNTELILELLEENDQKATIFMLGWIADKYPSIIRMIDKAGHEIGLHSYGHQLIYEQTPQEFRLDLLKSIDIISNALGKGINMYRAPGFSITNRTTWAFEILAEAGIEIDSSIFPTTRLHGGYAHFPTDNPCSINANGISIKEFPVNTFSFFNQKLVFSGGGYFRAWPYPLIHKMTKNSDYIMAYFHPRDFDVKQPMIKDLSLYRKFRSYYSIKNTAEKLKRWINNFNFVNIMTADRSIDWSKKEIIDLQQFK